ncbi:MAG TPA: hydroxymethylbilane synthase [Flavobacterium sp.]|nr:hydroxymethylbilane synthase [Flavobacterium sp.]
MDKTIRIGTRESQLALWQAHTVERKLNDLGYKTQIIKVKSQGDIILDKPLYELGITGIFTKTLDLALINREIDIAVHSMKDVPTSMAHGVVQTAVLERHNPSDILVYNDTTDFLNQSKAIVATGSLRRKAQWLHKFPTHQITDLRGNVNTRLQKLKDNGWNGAIFAQAGLDRIDVKPENNIVLDWMIPAPAQGAVVVVSMGDNSYCVEATQKLNNTFANICTTVERDFLKTLEGGCTAPIGALAQICGDELRFRGVLLSLDGTQKIEVDKTAKIADYKNLGATYAHEILSNGGVALMQHIKNELGN